MQPVIDLIIDFAEDSAKEPFDFSPARLLGALCQGEERREKQMRAAFALRDKQERTNAIEAAVDAPSRPRCREEDQADANLYPAIKQAGIARSCAATS